MNNPPTCSRRSTVLAVIGAALLCVVGCNKPPPPHAAAPPAAGPAHPPAAVPATNDVAAQYVSVFEELPPAQGKDPFFPKSHRRDPVATPAAPEAAGVAAAPVAPILVLKGVVGSKTRRFALINTETMAAGETASVRVPDGHVRVCCMEIGPDYVWIKVEGEAQPKRLELGK
jgi:hypothetical protein